MVLHALPRADTDNATAGPACGGAADAAHEACHLLQTGQHLPALTTLAAARLALWTAGCTQKLTHSGPSHAPP